VALVAAALAVGCASGPDTILESDVPLPPGLSIRASSEVDRRDTTLTGGFFVLYGEIDDPIRLGRETAARFATYGWRATPLYESPHRVRLECVKGTRRATVELVSRRIDPMMSSGTVRLSDRREPAAEADAGS